MEQTKYDVFISYSSKEYNWSEPPKMIKIK